MPPGAHKLFDAIAFFVLSFTVSRQPGVWTVERKRRTVIGTADPIQPQSRIV